ncbi:MAG: transglutaminase-like domain-containing protein [Myxococcota bacterium]
MADLPPDIALPVPETDDLGRYLEDTITIDWQTPSVMEAGRRLLAGLDEAGARVERLFRFVRDEIDHSFDLDEEALARRADRSSAAHASQSDRRGIACRASEVLALGHGLCFAKSHLLAALLRIAGHPAGFCYARLVDDERPRRFVLHGFVAAFWSPSRRWLLLDPRGDRPQARPPIETSCRFVEPFSLAWIPDPERGESLLPFVYKRPARRIVDWLERVPDRATLRRTLPDALD